MTARFVSKGYNACQLALYSTKAADVLTRVVLEAARVCLHPDGMVDMVVFGERIHVMRPRIQAHFIDGAFTFVADECPRPVLGSYLQIVCPISGNSEEAEASGEFNASAAVENCATLISMMHGEFVALERHYNARIALIGNETSVQTEGRFIRQTMEHEPLNQKMARIFDEQGDSGLLQNSTAMSLLHRAHHEDDDTNKFLFMWLALEVILGSGNDRRRFALDTMQSEPLSVVINELRMTRDALVHDGAFVRLTQQVFLRVKCIILMGMAANETTRRRLLDFLLIDLAA
jgi:hypothetical protein